MGRKLRKVLAGAAVLLVATSAAGAQRPPENGLPPAFAAPPVTPIASIAEEDRELIRQGLAAARSGDAAAADAALGALSHPVARKLVQWAKVDAMGGDMAFFELDQARRDLWGWPRKTSRETAAERRLPSGGLSPRQTIAWFEDHPPRTLEGASALAGALRASGNPEAAQRVIRTAWTELPAGLEAQTAALEEFGAALGHQDHAARLDMLLYGGDGPAVQAMLALVPADQAALGRTRLAYQADAANAEATLASLSPALRDRPGLVLDRAHYLRTHGQEARAFALVRGLPAATAGPDGGRRAWQERWALAGAAMRAGAWTTAYQALEGHGLPPGADLADAEFTAGWIALRKLGDPALADKRFEQLQRAGSSPITLGRAYYWRGRAHEAMGDRTGAQGFYRQGARFPTAFYGQLAAEKAGIRQIVLEAEAAPTQTDRARFEGRELVRAARILAECGERDLFRTFVLSIDDTLPNREESALLVDLAREHGDQDLAMRVVRTAAQRGFILPERGYPVRPEPGRSGVEPALVLGIVRQESGFDPKVRSGVGARGMMQLMPGTARTVARQLSLAYADDMLDDPEVNMRLGSAYMRELVDGFEGSYLLAAAGYNAGPGRPAAWIGSCSDPRAPGSDPTDFIECIPFSETRNYVMRVLEGTQVYRARLNGGQARLTLSADLKRGG